ncbi:MAG: tyrosine--tRNA ligase [candidate division Zixibacteria bacterium]|nr:tyrosine--tRNA ligase [candidate division Zixibacteria bacterium]
MFLSVEKQLEIIKRGAVEVIPEGLLRKKLERSFEQRKPLRVKQGFDPTAPDIHLGHTVGLRKLKQFQDLGHQIVLIVGDYTGRVGDPSGRSATRPQLTGREIEKNAATYLAQFFKVLDKNKTEVRKNGEWFARMNFDDVLGLCARFTVARMLERDDFEKRYKAGSPISVHELLYPIMQAYDSAAVKADLEIGATEQKFNLLAGRQLQEEFGQEPQVILTLPVLVGTDGANRMSKSLGNYIGIAESPEEIFGKTMSIPDGQIFHYFELAADVPAAELEKIQSALADKNKNPMELKKQLAHTFVRMYHGEGEARKAKENFERVFSKKEIPDDVPVFPLPAGEDGMPIIKLLTESGLVVSASEGRRLVEQGAVELDSERISDIQYKVPARFWREEKILRVGKRRFLRLIESLERARGIK